MENAKKITAKANIRTLLAFDRAGLLFLFSAFSSILIQKFSFPKIKMQFEPVFLQVLWQFLLARRSRDFGISRGAFLAAVGGENRPNYFKNSPHFRKPQGIGARLASLGGQFVLNFGRKNQLAILFLGKENFKINF